MAENEKIYEPRLFHPEISGFKYLFIFTSEIGEMIQFDYSQFFQMGGKKPPSSNITPHPPKTNTMANIRPYSPLISAGGMGTSGRGLVDQLAGVWLTLFHLVIQGIHRATLFSVWVLHHHRKCSSWDRCNVPKKNTKHRGCLFPLNFQPLKNGAFCSVVFF